MLPLRYPLGRVNVVRASHHASPDAIQFHRKKFEQGGVFGTVVMAPTPQELNGLGLPSAPPWASSYLPERRA